MRDRGRDGKEGGGSKREESGSGRQKDAGENCPNCKEQEPSKSEPGINCLGSFSG